MRKLLSIIMLLTTPITAIAEEEPNGQTYVGLEAAIVTALDKQPGYVLEIEPESEYGVSVYEIDIVNDSIITEIKIDRMTGNILESETAGIKDRIKQYFTSDKELDDLRQAKFPMQHAIVNAESTANARAIKAKFEYEDNLPVYEVTLINGYKKIIIIIDANSGETIKVTEK